MKPSVKFIKMCHDSEACRLRSYKDSGGKWTIGWGHTGPEVCDGMTITQERADELFINDCAYFIGWLNMHIPNLTQNQFDAVLDLIYNIGPGNLIKNSELYQALRNDPNNRQKIESGFLKHVWTNGTHDGIDNDGDGLIDEKGEVKRLSGLENRRKRELKLYFE